MTTYENNKIIFKKLLVDVNKNEILINKNEIRIKKLSDDLIRIEKRFDKFDDIKNTTKSVEFKESIKNMGIILEKMVTKNKCIICGYNIEQPKK